MIKQIAVVLGIATLSLTPSLAHAQENDRRYPPGESITATATATSCTVPNEPTVSYLVAPVGIDPDPVDPVTITFYDVNGKQIGDPFTGPLQGSFLYPGTTFDPNGEVITWPGWVYENGTWVESESESTIWRQGITIRFDVGLTTSVAVQYPDDNPNCGESGVVPPTDDDGQTQPTQTTQAGELPRTGTNGMQLFLQIGLLLLVGGGIVLITTHRRSTSAS